MKVGLMQPYIFPYIGYFQLINAVDIFVIYDDVQYMREGWINRNRILLNNKEYLFTLPVRKEVLGTNINKISFSKEFPRESNKLITNLLHGYKKAPYFKPVFELIEKIFQQQDDNISTFITQQLKDICEYLSIKTPFILSSELTKNNALKAEARVIEINKVLNSTHYINPIGGLELYNTDKFLENNMKLNFIKTRPTPYFQFSNEFIPYLSIIDVMMFNSKEEIAKMLVDYDLV